jgi:DNA-binding XRE family transcriptional regulator
MSAAMTPADMRAWRTHMDWTQTEAADKLGITQQVYSRHERGEVKIDMRTALACAARAAGLEPWPHATNQIKQDGINNADPAIQHPDE